MTETRVEDRDLIQGDDTLGLDQAEPSSEEAAPQDEASLQDEAAGPNERSAPAAGTGWTDAAGAGATDDGSLTDEADQEPAEGRRDIG